MPALVFAFGKCETSDSFHTGFFSVDKASEIMYNRYIRGGASARERKYYYTLM